MSSLSSSTTFRLLAVVCCCAALAVGCGKGGPSLTPVSGTITLDGKPLTAGAIVFVPDEAKGNKAAFSPNATIDSSGKYELFTNGKSGAPVGWYKVTVSAMAAGGVAGGEVKAPDPKPGAPSGGIGGLQDMNKPSVQIDPKYGNAGTTPLSVEVVANAAQGKYDLKVTK